MQIVRPFVQSSADDFAEFAEPFGKVRFVSLTVYMDETGTHAVTGNESGGQSAGVAGLVAWGDEWARFNGEWKAVLDAAGVPSFHFSEWAAFDTWGPGKANWPYKGWTAKRHGDFVRDLARIVGKTHQFAAANFLSVKAFTHHMRNEAKTIYKAPYDFCLQAFFVAVARQLYQRWGAIPGNPRTVFLCDWIQDKKLRARTDWWYHHAKSQADPENRMGELCFIPPDCKPKHLGLQGADLLAGLLRQRAAKFIEGAGHIDMRELEIMIRAGTSDVIGGIHNIPAMQEVMILDAIRKGRKKKR